MKLANRVRYFLLTLILFISFGFTYAAQIKPGSIPIDTVKISGKDFQANLDSLLNNFFVSQSLKINTNKFNFSDTEDLNSYKYPFAI